MIYLVKSSIAAYMNILTPLHTTTSLYHDLLTNVFYEHMKSAPQLNTTISLKLEPMTYWFMIHVSFSGFIW